MIKQAKARLQQLKYQYTDGDSGFASFPDFQAGISNGSSTAGMAAAATDFDMVFIIVL